MDSLPPNQFNTVEDGEVVRTAAEKVRQYAAISTAIETALVAITCVVVIGIAVGLYGLADTNKRGVNRIIDCTTQGRPCYEEQQERTNELISTFLVTLNEEHLTIECLLDVVPAARDEKTLARCKDEAHVATQEKLKEIEAKANQLAEEAKRKERGK